jgi:ribosomal protein L33
MPIFKTFGLISTVTFPTRMCASTSTALDSIFMDSSKCDYYCVLPLHNGLSDHEALLLTVEFPVKDKDHQTCSYRKIDHYTVTEFLTQLSYETWDEIFANKDVNQIFNSFLNNYFRIFNASFPKVSKHISAKSDITLVTKGIKMSCKHKRELYLMMKNSRNMSVKLYYDKYCKILNKVIISAKKGI